ncbi:MAG: hypothetical protein OEV44_04155 [Spirochaetota bacterium]|nr:hypothetical protein [Spirochaetota bacterium]
MNRFTCRAILEHDGIFDISSSTDPAWVNAEKYTLYADENHFQVAGISIPYSEILNARLAILPSAVFFPMCILTIKTKDNRIFHFGLRYNSFWKKDLPFSIERIVTKPTLLWPRRIAVWIILLTVISYLVFWITKL